MFIGSQLYFSQQGECPKCHRFTFVHVCLAQETWMLIEAYCKHSSCNPELSQRQSVPELIMNGQEAKAFLPFMHEEGAKCPFCERHRLVRITRGNRLVASECVGCSVVRVPSLSEDPLPRPRPASFDANEFRAESTDGDFERRPTPKLPPPRKTRT